MPCQAVKDYYDVITKPMSLATIGEKLKSRDYQSFSDCAADFDLIVNNCIQYNGKLCPSSCFQHGADGV